MTMLNSKTKQQLNQPVKGFTIIEVVLVLAIAGLIFLVVFQALPRLQASRRDNQRKRHTEFILAAALDYESNTGELPSSTAVHNALGGTDTEFTPYVGENFQDPSGVNYTGTNAPQNGDDGSVRFYRGGWKCNPGSTWQRDTSARGFIYMNLERGSYCIDIT